MESAPPHLEPATLHHDPDAQHSISGALQLESAPPHLEPATSHHDPDAQHSVSGAYHTP